MDDWNRPRVPLGRVLVVDETLRDGLQSASARDPSIARKLALLHAMPPIGVDRVSLGLPAAGQRARDDATRLAREIVSARLPLRPTAAGRTMEGDVRAIAEVGQRAGVAIDVYAFIGSSPIRRHVEGWDVAFLMERVRCSGEVARREGMPFCLVLEDTTRTPPEVLREMFAAAIDVGAVRLCLCDTVGHADPGGTAALVSFARDTLGALGAPSMELDWHAHNDRGLALGNALAAAAAGVTGIHGTAGGIGERCGNAAIENVIAYLVALDARAEPDAGAVERYLRVARDALSGGAAEPPLAKRDVPEAARTLQMRVNGDTVELAARPSRTLLEVLRYDLDLVGTKQGCDKGDCGACTVLVDGQPTLACLTLALACEDRDVTTVESLPGEPALDPLLQAFDRCGAGQCGFCTSGMLLTAKALLARDAHPTRATIREAISGNLCRCTGYGAIVDAVDLAAGLASGEVPSVAQAGSAPLPAPLPAHERLRT